VLVGAESHTGEALDEVIGKAPVGGRLAAFQQARLGHPEHAGGFATDDAACSVTLAQPGHHTRMLRAERIEISPEGRQDHHIGVVQGTIHGDGDTAEGTDRLAVRADQTGFESRGEVKAELLAVAQAGHVEEILGLGEC